MNIFFILAGKEHCANARLLSLGYASFMNIFGVSIHQNVIKI